MRKFQIFECHKNGTNKRLIKIVEAEDLTEAQEALQEIMHNTVYFLEEVEAPLSPSTNIRIKKTTRKLKKTN